MLGYPKRPEYMLKPDDETFAKIELEAPHDPRAAMVYWSAMSVRFRIGATYYSKVSFWWSMFSLVWATISITLVVFGYCIVGS